MQFGSVIRRIALILITGALLAALTGCAGEARLSAAPSSAGSDVARADARAATMTPAPSPEPAASPTPTSPPVGRSLATVPPPRQLDAPVSVELPSADIAAEVVPVGVDGDGQMELPDDPDVVGWYRYGPTAGDGQGSVVIAGHVDSRKYGLGQLARLQNSEVGDEIAVTTDAGEVRTYTVVDVRYVAKPDLPIAEVFSREGDERLLLITCAGDFERSRGYHDNIIVTAEPK